MRQLTPKSLSRLLLLVYEAAERPELWPRFLESLRGVCDAQGANIVLQDFRTGEAQVATTERDAAETAKYVQHYASVNPWMPKNGPVLPNRNILPGEAILPTSRLRKTEFYADWGKRNDVVHTWAANLELRSDRFLFLSVDRGERRGSFDEGVGEVFSLLAPHVSRALHLHDLVERASTLKRALDHVSVPVFLVDADARILDMTGRAKVLLERQDGFAFQGSDRLRAVSTQSQRELVRALGELGRGSAPSSRALRVQRRGSARDHIVVISREPSDPLWRRVPRFEVVVLQPDISNAAALRTAGKLYGLTPAETRLVGALIASGSLKQALENLRITRNTGRTHMSAIFGKTGTHHQVELVRLFAAYSRLTHVGEDS